ncbi:MAG: hypothetical protein JW863_19840 [Chitinispirillaceae bacterium]|nr:hypothetical protein [Chitinispirillaceae bacterium]
MRNRMMFALLTLQCAVAAAPLDLDLPQSSIQLPWSVFNRLSNRSPDTVFVPPEIQPPTAIVFSDMQLSAVLHDSMAEMSLSVGYTVFSGKGWVEIQVFDREFSGALSSVSLPDGDFLRATEGGCFLTAATAGKNRSRRLSVTYTVPAHSEAGDVSVTTSLPRAVECRLDITAPVSYAEVIADQAFLSGKQRSNNAVLYRFLLNATAGSGKISYKVPVKKSPADTVGSTAVPSDTIAREPVITVRQESAVFAAKENAFIFTALRLSVVRAPVTRFSVVLPERFSLLTLSGNGIQKWTKTDSGSVLEVKLGFALEGNYSLYLAGEQPIDTCVAIPEIRVREAAHQSGTFGLVIGKGNEALSLSASNSAEVARAEFLRGLSPGFSDSIVRYGRSLQEMVIAGEYFKIPFSAVFLIRRHVPVPVADAICDAGSVRAVISKDAKVLTQAGFHIRHRGRQFITLRLPDSANLWSVTLDGVQVSPSRGENGEYKISLQRNYAATGAGHNSQLEVTYLQTMKPALSNRTFQLQTPVPDIPVGKLELTVFYPEQWIVNKTTGTFTAAQTTLLGKRYYRLGSSERQSLYRTLQKSNTARQTTAQAASSLSLMPETPNYLYAISILIVDEQPWIGIRFGSVTVHRFIVLLSVFGGIVVVVAAVIFGRRSFRSSHVSE